ncbi:MAG: penicillin-binding protein 2 [Eubacteriales bacterium]|nr:penicillin-binding protein 2 [Eubacteriales bacterium]
MKISKNNTQIDFLIPPFVKKKLMLCVSFITLAFIALFINLYLIVYNNSSEYEKIVLSQRQSSYSSRTIPQKRGEIKDTNGITLAISKKVYNLILDPKVMLYYEDRSYLTESVALVADFFKESIYSIYDIINQKKDSSYVRYKLSLSYDEKIQFEEMINTKNEEFKKDGKKDRIKGLWFEEEYKRQYPYNSLLSNTIGFINESDNTGLYGLESYYNEILSGTNGRRYGYLDKDYDLNTIERECKDGYSLITSIDVNIQNIVEKSIKEWKEGDVGSKSASCIIMNPNNGEIIAMASSNSYDLNNPRDVSQYTEEEINTIGKENLWYNNWTNNCVSFTYEPGSTSKVFTVAGALEENVVNKESEFKCEGKITLTDGIHSWTIRCSNRQGHGDINLEESLMYSCNMAMTDISLLEGKDNFLKYQQIFGLGDKTNIDLPAEADTSSLVYSKDNFGRTALSTNSFGQNFNVTMIQMISAYASIINGGFYYEPHIVKRIEDENGKIIEEIQANVIRKTISKETSEFLKNALRRTVNEGTGKACIIKDYDIAGKTGTAEKLPREDKNYLVSFMGFLPADKPEYLIYVVVDEPNREGEDQAHSIFATNICKKIIEESLKYINVEKKE